MKILFAIEEVGGGGKERRLVEHLASLSKDPSYEIHLVINKDDIAYPKLDSLPIFIHKEISLSSFSLFWKLFILLKRINPDIVHTWSFKTSVYFSLLNCFFRYRFVAGFIGDTFGFSTLRLIIARLFVYPRTQAIVSNSHAGLVSYKVPLNKGTVIHNGFDFSRVSSVPKEQLIGLGVKTRFKVVMLANATQNKNYALFIDIAEKITKIRDDVTFISIGKILPSYKSMVAPYVNERHPAIKFMGFRSDVAALIRDGDVGVLCTYQEGISNAVIELMASGVPVITNDLNGGTKEVITHGFDGLIVTDESMLSAIMDLLDDNEYRTRLSVNAVNTIRSKFSLRSAESAYQRVYEKVLEN